MWSYIKTEYPKLDPKIAKYFIDKKFEIDKEIIEKVLLENETLKLKDDLQTAYNEIYRLKKIINDLKENNEQT